MPYLGTQPAETALTTGDLGDNIVDGTKTKDALIADYSDVTITASDLLMYGDATDSNNTKRDTVQGILDLAPSAGLNFISRTTISGTPTTVDVTSGIDSTYETYLIVLNRLRLSGQYAFHFLWGTSSGMHTSNYVYTSHRIYTSSVLFLSGTSASNCVLTSAEFDNSNANTNGLSGHIWMFNPAADYHTQFKWELMMPHPSSGVPNNYHGSAQMASNAYGASTADVTTQFRFDRSSGTFVAGGTIDLFGVARS